jgi:Phospholipase_D-nuclease N-terminal
MIDTSSLFIILLLIYILSFSFWTWALIDCLKEETDKGNTRLIWVIIIVLTYIIGAFLYYVIRRLKRIPEYGI